jgi:pantoate--beta-alanine ligase
VKTTRTVAETRAALAHGQVGLVPTMGAYHASTSRSSPPRAGRTIVVASLFVNPAQFGGPADLARYPRDEAADAAIAEEAGSTSSSPSARGALSTRLRPGST